VLALADGLATTPAVRPVGLPLAGPSSPVSVHVLPTDERRVAFLVDEAAHEANLNAASLPGFGAGWEFGACVGTPDVDTTDEVLHWLLFETWDATLSTPVNTGLVGSNRILQNDGYLATLAAEADQGPAGCDWSGDGTADDLVLRWVPDDTAAIVPENTVPLQEEVVSKPGGSLGVVALGQAFVAVVNASVAVPGVGNVQTDWLATVRPGESTAWRFQHGTANVPLGPDWLAPAAQSNRIGSTFRESPYGTSWNATPCGFGAPKDTDATDVVPIYPEFDDAQNKLTFPGASYAVQASNGGVSIAGAIAYFRVSEADDEVDYTGDGQQDDTVLVRNSVSTCAPVVMSVLNSDFGPAVVTDGVYGAGFLCDENQTDGVDLNADGDTTDRVLRWFRF
ncbi:MAG TPA: hypothetical protein VJP77_07035, partial [Planctomycetota bacterium]|nr:hypothetical protein [Planctomycetota bacterium]